VTLDLLPIKTKAVITKVGGEGELRCRLLDMGLIPKTVVEIRKVAPMGDPIELEIRGYTLTIRKEDAAKIEVTEDMP
jgi:ferrous iron transport protein A